jgi:hypothetical protein
MELGYVMEFSGTIRRRAELARHYAYARTSGAPVFTKLCPEATALLQAGASMQGTPSYAKATSLEIVYLRLG